VFLRKLTDEEIDRVKKSKDVVKEQRQNLQGDIKNQRKKIQDETKRLKGKPRDVDMFQHLTHLQDHLYILQAQFGALPIITGIPVIVLVEDESISMNYELLKKFDNSLDKSDFWQYDFKIKDDILIVDYRKHGQSGTVQLAGLPLDKTELLTGLPIIDLKGGG